MVDLAGALGTLRVMGELRGWLAHLLWFGRSSVDTDSQGQPQGPGAATAVHADTQILTWGVKWHGHHRLAGSSFMLNVQGRFREPCGEATMANSQGHARDAYDLCQ